MRLIFLIFASLFLSVITFLIGYDCGYVQALDDLTQMLNSDLESIEELYY